MRKELWLGKEMVDQLGFRGLVAGVPVKDVMLPSLWARLRVGVPPAAWVMSTVPVQPPAASGNPFMMFVRTTSPNAVTLSEIVNVLPLPSASHRLPLV